MVAGDFGHEMDPHVAVLHCTYLTLAGRFSHIYSQIASTAKSNFQTKLISSSFLKMQENFCNLQELQ